MITRILPKKNQIRVVRKRFPGARSAVHGVTADYSKIFRSETATVARGIASGIFGLLSGGKHPSALQESAIISLLIFLPGINKHLY